MYQVLEPRPSNIMSSTTEDPTVKLQDPTTVIYNVLEKLVPAALEPPPPIYHLPDEPNPIREESTLPSNEISTDTEAPPIPPFCLQDLPTPIHHVLEKTRGYPTVEISTDDGGSTHSSILSARLTYPYTSCTSGTLQ